MLAVSAALAVLAVLVELAVLVVVMSASDRAGAAECRLRPRQLAVSDRTRGGMPLLTSQVHGAQWSSPHQSAPVDGHRHWTMLSSVCSLSIDSQALSTSH